MAAPNGPQNNPEGTPENRNAAQTAANKLQEKKNQKASFLEEFRKSIERRTEKDRLPFYDELLEANSLDQAKLTKNELVEFLNEEENIKYDQITAKDININELKAKF